MRRLAIAIGFLVITVLLFGQWSESKHREELTDAEILDLHAKEKDVRDAQDALEALQKRIREDHGEGPHANVVLYDKYVVVFDKDSGE